MQAVAAFFAVCVFVVAVWFWIDIRSPKNVPELG